jgi:hypothetical protein
MGLARVGRLVIVLGILGCLRVVSECLQVCRIAMLIYFLITGLDAILAVGAIAVGNGLRRGKAWAPRAVLGLAGFSLANLIGIGLMLGPEVIGALQLSFSVGNAILVPRMLLYAVGAVFWPWAILAIVRGVPPESRTGHHVCYLASFLIGGMVSAIFFIQGR